MWEYGYNSPLTMFAWSILGFLFSLFFVLTLYFFYVFVDKKDISLPKKFLFISSLLPVLLLTPTTYNLIGFDLQNCEPIEGKYFLGYYFSLAVVVSVWILILAYSRYRKAGKDFKKQILLLTVGIELCLIAFSWSNILSSITLDWNIIQYGQFGMPIFLAFLVYLIVAYKAFNIRLLATEALVVSLVMLIGAQLFFVQNSTNMILTVLTLAIALVFGFYLIKATREEEKRREEAEIIATEESRLRFEAEKLAADLKKLNEAKTEFMLSAEHNLRLPLSVIKGYLDLLYSGSFGKIEENARKRIKSSMEASDNLIKMVDDILDVAKYQMGKGEFMKEKTDMSELLQEIVDEFRVIAENKGLYLKLEESKILLPMLMLDSRRLKSGLCNIVDNAIRYTEKGGIKIAAAVAEDNIVITVTDTGIGMDEEERKGLFSKTFERGKRAQSVHSGGKGISMYLTSQIVASQGGNVRVESIGHNEGSKFIVTIPVGQNE
ncbi:MAG: HAMP domain-containing sensor histidine kinase [Candidatus Nealsonbacteria bacterium]|nr:HAMP domain-containing sensor histidine kinase [Candidatus Nealsonbacteria bacterium]